MNNKRMGQTGYRTVSEQERLEVIEKIAARLKQEDSILFAFLFGSFPTESLFRDIDVGIFARHITRSDYPAYEGVISERLEDAIRSPFPVEVKIINDAPLPFRFNVLRGRFLFTRDDDFLVSYMARTALDYIDFAPLRRHYIHEAMA